MSPVDKLAVFLLQLMLLCVPACGAATEMLLVLSEDKPLYQDFAKNVSSSLPAGMTLTLVRRAEDYSAQQADLLVTVGVKAAEKVSGNTAQPMLAAMIPSHLYADLISKRHGKTSAVYLDQPLERQVRFLRAALPDRHRIGVLHGADTQVNIPALRSELLRAEGVLIVRQLKEPDTLYDDLEVVLGSSEVLLAVPDNTVYNNNNIRNILLSSYRRGIPLVGFSPAYVKAGALCAIYSTPEQVAAQTAILMVAFAKSGKLPAPQFSALYGISVNQEVARTLGIPLASAESLRLQIEKSSGGGK